MIKIILALLVLVPLFYIIIRLAGLFYFMYESRRDYTNLDTGPK